MPLRVDALPYKCIVGAERIGVVDEQYVIHRGNGKTLMIDIQYTLKEKQWRNEIVMRFGCCQYLTELSFTVVEKPEFTKCQCSSGGLYC